MVLKETCDTNIFTYIMATVGYSLFSSCNIQSSTFQIGNPLIQACDSVFMTIYMQKSLNVLAGFPRFFLVDLLDPGVWDCSSTVSSVGAGAGTSAGAGMSAATFSLSSDSENIEAEAVSDFVRWTRSCDIFSTELCST